MSASFITVLQHAKCTRALEALIDWTCCKWIFLNSYKQIYSWFGKCLQIQPYMSKILSILVMELLAKLNILRQGRTYNKQRQMSANGKGMPTPEFKPKYRHETLRERMKEYTVCKWEVTLIPILNNLMSWLHLKPWALPNLISLRSGASSQLVQHLKHLLELPVN